MTEQQTTPGVVLWAAERYNELVGHENLGPLSVDHGFLPAPGSNATLPASHAGWDDMAAALPEMHRKLTVRKAVDLMPLLPADRAALPDKSLQRSAVVLGLLAHAYFHLSPTRPAPPPPAITVPWADVCRRLGRSGPYLSYLDLIICNWRLLDPAAADPMRVSNMRLLVPTVDNEEEHIFHLTQTEILARTAPAVGAIVWIGDAVRRDDPVGVAHALATITTSLNEATRSSLPTINPRPDSRSYVDPVVWARTVAPFAVPIAPGALGPSGTAAPLFNLLDSLFGRPSQRSQLGREIVGHRAAYPQNWRRFLDAVDTVALGPYVERTGDPGLHDAYAAAIEAYAGEHGFLSRHRRKVFGYLEIAFKVGRGVTIGGFSGAPQDRTWAAVDRELEKARAERGTLELPAPATAAVRHPPAPVPTEAAYPMSELVQHNDNDHGYWVSIDGVVYDVSEFLSRHPGGPAVLQGYAGRDASQAYHRLHATSPAAAVALRRCRIGRLCPPDPVMTNQGTSAWVDLLCSVVELQNALRQDFGLRRGVGPSREPEDPRSPYLLERRVDTFERFIAQYLRPISDAAADEVWPIVAAATQENAAPAWMRLRMDSIWSGPAAVAAVARPSELRDRLTGLVAGDARSQEAELRRIDGDCERSAAACALFLADLKELLRGGMHLLEQAHSQGKSAGPDGPIEPGTCAGLIVIARRIPALLATLLDELAPLE